MTNDATFSSQAIFNEAIQLVNTGQIGGAMELCRNALLQSPNDVSITALLGALLLKSKEPAMAEKFLRRAIELAPNFAKPQEDLGVLLFHSGRVQESIGLLENAMRLDPASEDGWMALGRALAASGRGADADRAFEAAFDLNPVRKKLAHAAEHHRAGRFDEAEQAYREVLSADNNVDAMRFLAGICKEKDRPEESETLLRRAVTIAPDYMLAQLDLAVLYDEQMRHEEAIERLRIAVQLEPANPRPHWLLASNLAASGQVEEAMAAYQKLVDINPENYGAWLGMAHTLKTVGKQSDSIEAYRRCIELKPDQGETYWSLANLKTYRLDEADIAAMTATLEKGGLSEESEVNFEFALAKAYEDKKDFKNAWHYYHSGNQKQRMLETYDPVQAEVTNDEIIEVFNEELMRRLGGLGFEDARPIFIVGLPRSGSTLLEQILASHSLVEGTSELPYMGRVATSLNRNRADGINYPYAIRELKAMNLITMDQQYMQRAALHRHTDRPIFIDKMPNNFPSVGLIKLIMPNAKILDARRYPLDSTLSCYRQLFARGQSFVYDLMEIGEYFLQYQRLMDHWHEVIPGQVLTVQYEEVATDLETQVRRLLEFCELPFEENCLRFYETDRAVRTASSEQVRQPIYTGSIHFWRHYEAELGELIETLAPILPRYAQYDSINT